MSQMTQVTIDAMYGEQAALESQLAAVINNVPRDVVEQQKVEALIQDKKTEIQTAEKELREQGITEKVEGDEITFNLPGVDFKALPAEFITLIDTVVRADRRRIYAEEGEKFDKLTADHKETLRAADEREIQANRQNDSLQEKLKQAATESEGWKEEATTFQTENRQLTLDNQDLQERLKNAATQIEEGQSENKRLNSEISDMRAAATFGEKQAQQIIDVTPEETTTMQDLVNSLAKKYVAVTPIGGNWHEAVTADGSKDVLHTKDLPSLETQGSPFRGEDSGNTAANGGSIPSVVSSQTVAQEQQFPVIAPPSVIAQESTVQAQQPVGEVVAAPVTRTEHEALKARVEALEGKVA